MPEEGVEAKERDEILSLEEIERLASVFARLGVDKVRLTGGEPTVRKGYRSLVGRLAALPGSPGIHLTTNGSTLARDARELRRLGLRGINVSLDSLDQKTFQQVTRREGLDQVLDGIRAAVEAGLEAKINVVVLPGVNDHELPDFIDFFRDAPIQVRFIEFMPFLGNLWKPDHVVGYREMIASLEKRHRLEAIPAPYGAVAKEFRVADANVSVGFITSMTESFCDECNRIRVTADGRIKTCLFLPPQASLRDAMRTGAEDEELAMIIRNELQTKWAGHPPMHRWQQLDSLAMVQIGG